MAKYVVRPYYGYDCDSENGFNNGRYLDAIYIHADDPDAAVFMAMEQYIQENAEALEDCEIGGDFGDLTIYKETYREDGEGNETKDGDFYRYEYIDFNVATEVDP